MTGDDDSSKEKQREKGESSLGKSSNEDGSQIENQVEDVIPNADIRPSRFDMLKRNNRNNFNQFQEFI